MDGIGDREGRGGVDDEQLIAALAAGDEGALRELFARHAPWLAARLRRTLPVAIVEDVLQETFIAVWRGAKSYRAEGAPGAWLWGIARRQAAGWARRHGRPELAPVVEPVADPAGAAAQRVDLERAFAALGPCGTPQRELARLLLVEDRPLADVAARLGIPEGTVKSRAYALRRALRAALGRM
jgi:RNA polymerase sigma-70 factor (ECF subfamily)